MIIFGQISLFLIGWSNIFLSEFFFHFPICYGRLVLLKPKVFNILPIVPSSPISFILANLAFFIYVGMAWIVKLSGLTLANKPLNGLHAYDRKFGWYSTKYHAWRNTRSLHCLHELSKRQGTTLDMQTKFMLSSCSWNGWLLWQ